MKEKHIEQKWGFGMAPIKPEVQKYRHKCVQELLNIINNRKIDSNYEENSGTEFFSIVKGLFNRIKRQDQWDWFTVYRQFGSPGTIRSGKIAYNISLLRQFAIGKRERRIGSPDGMITTPIVDTEIIDSLENLKIKTHLEIFLGIRKNNFSKSETVYILSTREHPKYIKIGFTTRSVEERVNEINSSTGVIVPFGVRGIFNVENAQDLETKIHNELSEFRIRKDREFFDMEFQIAKNFIIDLLKKENINQI